MKKAKWFLFLSIMVMLSLLPASSVLAQDERPIRIIFLHHSCGQNLIEGGQVREGLTRLGYEFFDHGYNGEGLRLADGSFSGESFNVPDENTDPDGFSLIFSQPLHDPPDNTFSHLMRYDVIAFKSCFPTSNIADDNQLAAYQTYYLSIRDTTDRYPEKLFVIVTPPPQVPNSTNTAEARRARQFAEWLGSDEYLNGHPNLITFDFFGMLAGDDNTLQPGYRVDEWDAHPNDLANREIGPDFVDFLDASIRNYFGEGYIPPEIVEPVEEEPEPDLGDEEQPQTETGDGEEASATGDEANIEERNWFPETDGMVSSINCSLDPNVVITGESSLYVNYALGDNGYASCANQFDTQLDWTGEEGVSFYLRSDRAGQELIFMVFAGSLDNPVPFEVRFASSGASVESWERLEFRWDEFNKPEWFGDEGLSAVDPAHIISFVVSLESEVSTQGQFWLDGLSPLVPAEQESPSEEQDSPPEEQESAPEEQEGGGGICPFSTIIMPLLMGILWVVNHKNKAAGQRPDSFLPD